MAAKTRSDDRDSATDPDIYLPAGIAPSGEPGRIERLWEHLFNHGVEPPK